MTSADLVRPDSETRYPTIGTKVLLVGAPLLMAIGRGLLVPLDDQDWDGVMTSMAANRARSDAGWLIALAATGLLTVTAVLLANRLRDTGRVRMAMFATVATALGWAASAGLCASGLFLSVAADAPDRAAQVLVQEDFVAAASGGAGFVMVVLGAIGYIVLAVGLARSGLVPKGAAVLVAVGGAATLITTPGPVTPLLVLAALLLTAGHGLAVMTER